MKSKLFIMIFILLILISCDKNSNYTRKRINGIVYHTNKNKPSKQDLNIQIEKIVQIDGYKFSVDSGSFQYQRVDLFDDKILIADLISNKVKVFDFNGDFIEEFGGKGNGPGEFSQLFDVLSLNDTIFASDLDHRNFSKFDKKYNYVSTVKKELPSAIIKLDSNYIGTNITVSMIGKEYFKYEKKVSLFTEYFEAGKELRSLVTEYGKNKKNINPELYMIHYAVDKDNKIYIANNDLKDYSIDIFDRQGNHIETITKSYRAIVRTREEYKQQEKYLKTFSNFRDLDYVDVKYYTSIYHCLFDHKNRLWVLTPDDEQGNQNTFKFDIFENGKYLNSLSLNLDFDFIFNGDFLGIYGDKLVVNNIYTSRVTIYKILN